MNEKNKTVNNKMSNLAFNEMKRSYFKYLLQR